MPFPNRPESMRRKHPPKLKPGRKPDWVRTGSMLTDCRMKASYDTYREAKRSAKRNGSKLRPYRCVVCGKFHLFTHSKKPR